MSGVSGRCWYSRTCLGDAEGLAAELFPRADEQVSIESLTRAIGKWVVDVDILSIKADEQYSVLVFGGVDWAVRAGPGDPVIGRFELTRDPGNDWGAVGDLGEDVVKRAAGEVDRSSGEKVIGEPGEGSVVYAVADPVSVAGNGTNETVVRIAPAHDVAEEVATRAKDWLGAVGGLQRRKGQVVDAVADRGQEHR